MSENMELLLGARHSEKCGGGVTVGLAQRGEAALLVQVCEKCGDGTSYMVPFGAYINKKHAWSVCVDHGAGLSLRGDVFPKGLVSKITGKPMDKFGMVSYSAACGCKGSVQIRKEWFCEVDIDA